MNYNFFIKNESHCADILAIPFFVLMVYYFCKKKNRTIIEDILLLFGVSGLVLDTEYSCKFIIENKNKLFS